MELIQAYNQRLGRPSSEQELSLQDACKRTSQIKTWGEFFEGINIPLKTEAELATF